MLLQRAIVLWGLVYGDCIIISSGDCERPHRSSSCHLAMYARHYRHYTGQALQEHESKDN